MACRKQVLGKRRNDGDILGALELHSADQIRAALDAGLDPNAQVRGKPLVNWLTGFPGWM